MAERMYWLLAALKTPETVLTWTAARWSAVLSMARRELVLGHLAAEMETAGIWTQLPERIRVHLDDGLRFAAHSHVQARHDALYFGQMLAPLGCAVIVLKGSAYVLGGHPASAGRLAGDLDVLVPRSWLGAVEQRLAEENWHVSFKSEYDDHYYRTYAHELPPIVHDSRPGVLDLHHTILPLTCRLKPDAGALVAAAQDVPGTGLKILSPEDQVLHSAAHLFYDGDLTGGLRNLHDLHRLLRVHAPDANFWTTLIARADLHQLGRPLYYALHAAMRYFGTPIPVATLAALQRAAPAWPVRWLMGRLVHTRLASATTGRHPLRVRLASFLLYIRSHWLRMPPAMLARHLWTKFRMNRQQQS